MPGVTCLFLLIVSPPFHSIAAEENAAIRFEAVSEPMYAIQSRFVGSASVRSNAIEVQIESGEVSFSPKRKPGEQRLILEYNVGLLQPEATRSKMITYSPMVALGSNLVFGQKLVLGPASLSVPLANITARTNHWLLFNVRDRFGPPGFPGITGTTHSATATNLFTNLEVTGLTMPSMLEKLAGGFWGFIVRHQKQFPVIRFLPPEQGSETAFQHLDVNQNIVGTFAGRQYTGIQFTVPDWLDGDLEYAFVYLYGGRDELRRRPSYTWGVTCIANTESPAMNDVERVPFDGLPKMHARFPFTDKGYLGGIRRNQLVPGETYCLWWAYEWGQGRAGAVLPNLAVALTIRSEQGQRKFGEIVWR